MRQPNDVPRRQLRFEFYNYTHLHLIEESDKVF